MLKNFIWRSANKAGAKPARHFTIDDNSPMEQTLTDTYRPARNNGFMHQHEFQLVLNIHRLGVFTFIHFFCILIKVRFFRKILIFNNFGRKIQLLPWTLLFFTRKFSDIRDWNFLIYILSDWLFINDNF